MDATDKMRPALPFTLRPSKGKQVLLLLGSLAFTAGGAWMIRTGEWIGWFCAGFFGFGTVIFFMQLCTNRSSLTVAADGMEIRTLFRTSKIKWTDISEFGICVMRHNGVATHKMVGFNYVADYPKAAKGRAVSRAMAGFEGAVPDTYGMSIEAFVEMLRTIHQEQVQVLRDTQSEV